MSFRGRGLVQERDKTGDFVCSGENREEEIGKASLLQFGVWGGGREGAGRGEEKTHGFGWLERACLVLLRLAGELWLLRSACSSFSKGKWVPLSSLLRVSLEQSTAALTYNCCTQKTETGRSQVQGQPWLWSEILLQGNVWQCTRAWYRNCYKRQS